MDNIQSDEFISNNGIYSNQNQVAANPPLTEKTQIFQENNINPNSAATTNSQNVYPAQPIAYSRNIPPQNYNQNFAPQAYQQQPYNPNIPPQVYQQPYNPNLPPGNAYIQNGVIVQNSANFGPSKCIKNMLLVMAILQFFIIIIDIIFIIKFNHGTGMVFIIIDDIGIIVCAILFLLSFIYSSSEGNKINGKVRTIITAVVWFVGFAFRGIANMKANSNNIGALFGVMMIRTLILFFSIPVSFLNIQRLVSSTAILNPPLPVSPM